MFELALIVINTALLLGLIMILASFKRSLPDVEQILVDVGGDISEKMGEIFKEPMVKRAMSTLGKQGGEARASKALKNRVAEKALGQNVLLKKALEYLDITPMEGLELMSDSQIGPVIRNLMAGFQKGSGNFLGGLGGAGSNLGAGRRNNGNRVPNMS